MGDRGDTTPFFIRLRRRPRALPVDECVSGVCANLEPKYHCFGGFRHWRITLRSLGVGGYSFGGTTGLARGAPFFTLIQSLKITQIL